MSKHKNSKKNITIKHKSLLVSLVAVFLAVTIFNLTQVNRYQAPVLYHGPNPNTMFIEKADKNVLGSSVSAKTRRQRFPSPTPTLTPTSTPTNTNPSITPTPSSKYDYGVAAGGSLTSYSSSDLDRYFSELSNLGVKWVRYDFDWAGIQPDNSTTYQWDSTDRVTNTATKYGLKILGIVAYTPKWAAVSTCTVTWGCAPADPQAFGRFASLVATRYKSSVNTWEIWNEPNNVTFWQPRPNITDYEAVLKEASTQIRVANPQSTILNAGLSASEDDAKGAIAPITFMNAIYNDKANQYFDAVAIHPYAYPASVNYPASWNTWQQISVIRQLMIDKGDGNKKIWVTEYGAPTGGPGVARTVDQLTFNYNSDYMTEAAQQNMLQQATAQYVLDSSWMGPLFWYSFRDNGTSNSTPENFFGLTRFDWSKKPAYDTFHNAILGN
jgi:hypothetical protein